MCLTCCLQKRTLHLHTHALCPSLALPTFFNNDNNNYNNNNNYYYLALSSPSIKKTLLHIVNFLLCSTFYKLLYIINNTDEVFILNLRSLNSEKLPHNHFETLITPSFEYVRSSKARNLITFYIALLISMLMLFNNIY